MLLKTLLWLTFTSFVTALHFWLLFTFSYYNTSALLQLWLLSQVVSHFRLCFKSKIFWTFSSLNRILYPCYCSTTPIPEINIKCNLVTQGYLQPFSAINRHKCNNIFAIQVINENILILSLCFYKGLAQYYFPFWHQTCFLGTAIQIQRDNIA